MKRETPEVIAARNMAHEAIRKVQQAPSFNRLPQATQAAILRDLGTIREALEPGGISGASPNDDPYSFALETPQDFQRRLRQSRFGSTGNGQGGQQNAPARSPRPRRVQATQAIAERAGALIDEIDFPTFVAGLVNGTFDAIVDSAIRQMEAFADLVSAVAKNTQDFTRDNVTTNQARDWLVEQFPNDLELDLTGPQPKVRVVPRGDDFESSAPAWLAEFGLEGEELTEELVEERLVPAAREKMGANRLQMLATMVLMGMNRINVQDGKISARVRFRAAARDRTAVDYAVSQDPGRPSWGERGSPTYETHSTMISTVGVNVQADSMLKAELFGAVEINFASETLPLDRFVDQAQIALLQRNSRVAQGTTGGGQTAPATTSPPPAPPAPPPVAAPPPSASPAVPPSPGPAPLVPGTPAPPALEGGS